MWTWLLTGLGALAVARLVWHRRQGWIPPVRVEEVGGLRIEITETGLGHEIRAEGLPTWLRAERGDDEVWAVPASARPILSRLVRRGGRVEGGVAIVCVQREEAVSIVRSELLDLVGALADTPNARDR